MTTAPDLLALCDLQDDSVINIYQYGSRVYGTSNADSDWDFTIIVKNDTKFVKRIVKEKVDVNIYSHDQFVTLVQQGTEFQIIEAIFLPREFTWKWTVDYLQFYKLDKLALREAVSKISSKGFAYAKICWQKNGDVKKAKKNFVHCIRNTLFGIQLAQHGRIVDYHCAAQWYTDIFADESKEWEHYMAKFGRPAKDLHSQFLALMPPKPVTEAQMASKKASKQRRADKKKAKMAGKRAKKAAALAEILASRNSATATATPSTEQEPANSGVEDAVDDSSSDDSNSE